MQQVDLTDSDLQFRALFNYATIGMLVTNQKGEILNFNSFAESQFGYTRQEILGKSIEVLLPEDVRQKHVQTREGYIKSPANRPMGANRNLFARKKDGTIFPVEVSLSHYKAEEETHIIGFIIDISVRKKNELEINFTISHSEVVAIYILCVVITPCNWQIFINFFNKSHKVRFFK